MRNIFLRLSPPYGETAELHAGSQVITGITPAETEELAEVFLLRLGADEHSVQEWIGEARKAGEDSLSCSEQPPYDG